MRKIDYVGCYRSVYELFLYTASGIGVSQSSRQMDSHSWMPAIVKATNQQVTKCDLGSQRNARRGRKSREIAFGNRLCDRPPVHRPLKAFMPPMIQTKLNCKAQSR